MKTLSLFSENPPAIPSQAAWYLSSIAESKGKQELSARQSPQKLTALRQHALIQSAVSSNRIEGVTIEPSRVEAVVLGKPLLRDRNEEEVSGYREALKIIHKKGKLIEIAEPAFLDLHRLARGRTGDAGSYKVKDGEIIEKHADGTSRVRFKTVPAAETHRFMRDLVRLWQQTVTDAKIPYLVLLAAFNLDFLCIHPFRDGNGRVSRLLMLLQAYHGGYEAGRYISLERLIEENKERYYETLEESSRSWHEGRHDPWPYIQFVLFIFRSAYREFEERLGTMGGVRGEKRSMVEEAVKDAVGPFSIRELQDKCPGVSIDMIRHVLKGLQKEGKAECLGRGQSAQWRRIKSK
jgi:Fic family protein